MFTYVCVNMLCICMWGEHVVGIKSLPPSLYILFGVRISQLKPTLASRTSLASTLLRGFLCLPWNYRSGRQPHPEGIYMSSGDPNWSHHTYAAHALSTEPSPQTSVLKTLSTKMLSTLLSSRSPRSSSTSHSTYILRHKENV